MRSPKGTQIWSAVVLIAAIGVFYCATLREVGGWGDFPLYVLHAKNIATGVAYADTGYIYNPFHSSHGPPTYPPVFPLLLSPIYILFPGNLTAMQIEVILIFVMALWVIFLNFQHALHWKYLLATLLCIGLNPYFWQYKDNIVSDLPFLFFTYLCLFVIQRSYSPNARKISWRHGLTLGLLLYLAYGTRSIGVVLAVSLFIYDMVHHRKPTAFSVTSILVFFFFAGLQMLYLPGTAYADRLSSISVLDVFSNIFTYAKYGSYFWDNGYSKIALHIVSGTVFSLAAIGFISRMRGQPTVYEIFTLIYSAALLIYPAQHNRYLFPLIPLCIFYAFLGIQRLTAQRAIVIERVAVMVLLVMIFASYGSKYTTIQHAVLGGGIHKKESTDLFRYVEENTAKDSVIIFRKPRTLSLFTGRRASVYHKIEPSNDRELWDYFHQIHASYIIEGYFDEPYFRRFVAKYGDCLERLYSNTDFRVYRIRAFPKSFETDARGAGNHISGSPGVCPI